MGERRSRAAVVRSSLVTCAGKIVEQRREARRRGRQPLRFARAVAIATSTMSACLDVSEVDEGSPTATGGSSGVADASWDAPGSDVDSASKPGYLPEGRTYDHQLEYIEWSGAVSQVTITHKDETTLPASEGGASCANGCQEQVTRIGDGAAVWGKFLGLSSFSFQVGLLTDPEAGSVVLSACGQTVGTWKVGVPKFGRARVHQLAEPGLGGAHPGRVQVGAAGQRRVRALPRDHGEAGGLTVLWREASAQPEGRVSTHASGKSRENHAA